MFQKDKLSDDKNSINQMLLTEKNEPSSLTSLTLDHEKDSKSQEINNNSSIKAENDRFMKHSPLVTLLIMSVGPLSNLVSSVFETLNMYLISKRFNQNENSHAVEIIGFSSQFQTFMILIGNFFGQCFVTRVSALIGSGDRERAAQLTSDLFKLTFIISLVYCFAIFFVIKPFLHFVGTPSNILNPSFKFIVFQLIFNSFSNLYTLVCCFLQSIGNSLLLGICVVVSKIVQSAILTPFFLFVCKVSTTYMKLSTVVVDVIFSLSMFFVIFMGKFSLKPTFRMLFTFKLSKDTINSLIYPLPYILLYIGNCFAPMIILKCLTSNDDASVNQAVGGVFAIFNQIYSINQALPSSIVLAFLSTGNHAFGSNNMSRLKKLLFWALTISLSTSIIFSITVILFKTQITSWFVNDKLEIDLSSKMLPIPFYTSFFLSIGLIVYASLLILKKPVLSMIPLIVQILILCGGSEIFKQIFKDNFIKIFHIYNCSDIICFVIYFVELTYAIVIINRKESESISPILSNSASENN